MPAIIKDSQYWKDYNQKRKEYLSQKKRESRMKAKSLMSTTNSENLAVVDNHPNSSVVDKQLTKLVVDILEKELVVDKEQKVVDTENILPVVDTNQVVDQKEQNVYNQEKKVETAKEKVADMSTTKKGVVDKVDESWLKKIVDSVKPLSDEELERMRYYCQHCSKGTKLTFVEYIFSHNWGDIKNNWGKTTDYFFQCLKSTWKIAKQGIKQRKWVDEMKVVGEASYSK